MLDYYLETLAEQECERIHSATGDYPIDWMTEVAETAQADWTEDGVLDYDAAEDEITAHADHYIHFVLEQEKGALR